MKNVLLDLTQGARGGFIESENNKKKYKNLLVVAERPNILIYRPPPAPVHMLYLLSNLQDLLSRSLCVNKSMSTADVREKESLITAISQLSNC